MKCEILVNIEKTKYMGIGGKITALTTDAGIIQT